MGVFDNFIKPESERKPKRDSTSFSGSFTSPQDIGDGMNVPGMPRTFYPKSFEDLYLIIDELRLGKAVIVHLTDLKESTAVRVLDILTGATYALKGRWNMVVNEVFMFVTQDDQRF